MAQAKKAKKSARKPAKAAARRKTASKAAAKGAKSDVVYSDVRRDALAWQLSRLR
jgi:hypothetical protein